MSKKKKAEEQKSESTSKVESKLTRTAQVNAIAKSESLNRLKATCETLAARQANSEFECLVATCAVNLDSLREFVTRNRLIELCNASMRFVAHKSNETVNAEHSFDCQRAVHRAYASRIDANVSHSDDSLLDVILSENSKSNAVSYRTAKKAKRLQALRVSDTAQAILAEYREAIAANNAK